MSEGKSVRQGFPLFMLGSSFLGFVEENYDE
jgi:hypothetical protein